jgi:hypothetical protein
MHHSERLSLNSGVVFYPFLRGYVMPDYFFFLTWLSRLISHILFFLPLVAFFFTIFLSIFFLILFFLILLSQHLLFSLNLSRVNFKDAIDVVLIVIEVNGVNLPSPEHGGVVSLLLHKEVFVPVPLLFKVLV